MSKAAPMKLSKKIKQDPNSSLPDTGYAKWLHKMRKFTQSKKEACKSFQKDRVVENVKKALPSGSKYEGVWDMFSMTGYGQFIFPELYEDDRKLAVLYEGTFDEGEFHGDGEYHYENGIMVKGKFDRGVLKEGKVFFANGLEYTDTDWGYCKIPDRRFASECKGSLRPAGESQLTADEPTKEITDPDIYDTSDGLYDKNHGCVYSYDSRYDIERVPNKKEGKWIQNHCRSGYNGPLGPMPRLYENWEEPSLELPLMPDSAQFEDDDLDEFDDEVSGWRRSRRSTIGSKFKRRFSYKSTAITFGPTGEQ